MSLTDHQRAEHLIAAWVVEGIGETDRRWLEAHLESCSRCAEVAASTRSALGAFGSISVQVDRRLVEQTRYRVQARAEELRARQAHLNPLWISCALSWVLGVASAPLVWRAFEWLGHEMRVPAVVWQTGFALWWAVPAGTVAALLIWQQKRAERETGGTTLPSCKE